MTVYNGDILKVVVEVVLGDFTITQNVHYFHAVTSTDHLDSVILGVIETWIETAYGELSGALCDDYAIGDSTVHKIEWNSTLSKWEITYYLGLFTPTWTMVNTSEPLPNQVSAFATFNTARPQSRGRKFIMPFGEDQQAATILVAGAVTLMTNFADDVLDTISLGAGGDLYPGIVRSTTGDFLSFQSATITDVLGTQRRRRPGVGS